MFESIVVCFKGFDVGFQPAINTNALITIVKHKNMYVKFH